MSQDEANQPTTNAPAQSGFDTTALTTLFVATLLAAILFWMLYHFQGGGIERWQHLNPQNANTLDFFLKHRSATPYVFSFASALACGIATVFCRPFSAFFDATAQQRAGVAMLLLAAWIVWFVLCGFPLPHPRGEYTDHVEWYLSDPGDSFAWRTIVPLAPMAFAIYLRLGWKKAVDTAPTA